jgi:hypothetical protein
MGFLKGIVGGRWVQYLKWCDTVTAGGMGAESGNYEVETKIFEKTG